LKRRELLLSAATLGCGGGGDVAGFVFSKGGFTPSLVSAFWFAADDVTGANGSHPSQLVDRITGAVASPVGATGGTLETLGWGGQQKSILQSSDAWRSTAAAVTNVFNAGGGQNWWLCIVGMQLATVALPAVMPNQTIFSAGLSSDAQKYLALRENPNVGTIGTFTYGSQQFVQRFSAAAQTTDTSPEAQGPFPYAWFLQCDNAGLHVLSRDGLQEQSFTRATGGALGVDQVIFGGLIQGGVVTADGRYRWRHIYGGAGALSAQNISNNYSWINNDSRGFDKKRGMVGNFVTKTWVFGTGAAQSNQQGQGSPVTAVTAPRTYMLGFNSFVSTLADPWCDATGTPFVSVFINSGVGGAAPAWANALNSLGKYGATEANLFLPGGVGGSSMGSFWVVGAGTLAWNSPTGVACLRLAEAMRNFPNPVIVLFDWYQGESETLDAAAAAAWGNSNRAGTVRTTLNSFIAAMGYTTKQTLLHVINILPPTNWTSATPTNWTTERTSQTTFGTSFADCTTLQVQDGPWTDGTRLHVGIAAQNDRGQQLAALS
jgi:hypothetical protein